MYYEGFSRNRVQTATVALHVVLLTYFNRHAHHFSTLLLSLGVFHNWKLVHQSVLQRNCKCMEAVGHCPSKRLLRGPSFFPDEKKIGAAATHWTE
jgi:hypothetical protein